MNRFALALGAALLAGCATLEPKTVDMVRGAILHNASVAATASDSETREEATANIDVLSVVLRDATGEPLPADVQARLDAHRAGVR